MTLCTDFCLRNLEGTLCYLLDNETLRLHPDIFLPSEICDKLVNEYVSGLWGSGCMVWKGAGRLGEGGPWFSKKKKKSDGKHTRKKNREEFIGLFLLV